MMAAWPWSSRSCGRRESSRPGGAPAAEVCETIVLSSRAHRRQRHSTCGLSSSGMPSLPCDLGWLVVEGSLPGVSQLPLLPPPRLACSTTTPPRTRVQLAPASGVSPQSSAFYRQLSSTVATAWIDARDSPASHRGWAQHWAQRDACLREGPASAGGSTPDLLESLLSTQEHREGPAARRNPKLCFFWRLKRLG